MNTAIAENIVVQKGMQSLIDALGIVDAERFIVIMNRNKENYNEWRDHFFEKMTPDEYRDELIAFSQGKRS